MSQQQFKAGNGFPTIKFTDIPEFKVFVGFGAWTQYFYFIIAILTFITALK